MANTLNKMYDDFLKMQNSNNVSLPLFYHVLTSLYHKQYEPYYFNENRDGKVNALQMKNLFDEQVASYNHNAKALIAINQLKLDSCAIHCIKDAKSLAITLAATINKESVLPFLLSKMTKTSTMHIPRDYFNGAQYQSWYGIEMCDVANFILSSNDKSKAIQDKLNNLKWKACVNDNISITFYLIEDEHGDVHINQQQISSLISIIDFFESAFDMQTFYQENHKEINNLYKDVIKLIVNNPDLGLLKQCYSYPIEHEVNQSERGYQELINYLLSSANHNVLVKWDTNQNKINLFEKIQNNMWLFGNQDVEQFKTDVAIYVGLKQFPLSAFKHNLLCVEDIDHIQYFHNPAVTNNDGQLVIKLSLEKALLLLNDDTLKQFKTELEAQQSKAIQNSNEKHDQDIKFIKEKQGGLYLVTYASGTYNSPNKIGLVPNINMNIENVQCEYIYGTELTYTVKQAEENGQTVIAISEVPEELYAYILKW